MCGSAWARKHRTGLLVALVLTILGTFWLRHRSPPVALYFPITTHPTYADRISIGVISSKGTFDRVEQFAMAWKTPEMRFSVWVDTLPLFMHEELEPLTFKSTASTHDWWKKTKQVLALIIRFLRLISKPNPRVHETGPPHAPRLDDLRHGRDEAAGATRAQACPHQCETPTLNDVHGQGVDWYLVVDDDTIVFVDGLVSGHGLHNARAEQNARQRMEIERCWAWGQVSGATGDRLLHSDRVRAVQVAALSKYDPEDLWYIGNISEDAHQACPPCLHLSYPMRASRPRPLPALMLLGCGGNRCSTTGAWPMVAGGSPSAGH